MARTSVRNEQGQYFCGHCKQFKDLDQFNPVPPSQRGQKSQLCKECGLRVSFIKRQKIKLQTIGPEEYLKYLTQEQAQLQEKYKILFKYKQETE